MKRTIYSEEHEIFRLAVRRFLETHAVPHYESWELSGRTPDDFWKSAGVRPLSSHDS